MGAIGTSVAVELAAFFRRNGYVRRHDAARYAIQGPRSYKKGEEIRLVANGAKERVRIQRLLKSAGFKAGRPFRKSAKRKQFCVPIYGCKQVARFLSMAEETERCTQP